MANLIIKDIEILILLKSKGALHLEAIQPQKEQRKHPLSLWCVPVSSFCADCRA